ncbi:MAG: phage holin family protein [Solirubrobacteraceae bacterium]|nr:phage holin family protein [Solirubrobacteraceae bacterium]
MWRKLLVAWAGNIAAIFVAAWLLDGIRYGGDWWALVLAALVFSLVNAFVRPVVTVLSLPLIVLTLGIALFFVNLLMLYVTSWIVPDFTIDGFWSAVGATIVIWLVNALLSATLFRRFHEEERERERERRAR